MRRPGAVPMVLLAFAVAASGRSPHLNAQNGIRGDVIRDDQVVSVDALAVLSSTVGLPLPAASVPEEHGDAGCDGDVEAVDDAPGILLGSGPMRDVWIDGLAHVTLGRSLFRLEP